MQAVGETRTAHYRFYDDRLERLYTGISADPWRRWREHVLTASWYPQVKHWTVTWHETEQEARRAEDRGIKGERPQFNKAGALEPVPVRFIVPFGAIGAVCVPWVMLPWLLTAVAVIARWHWLIPVTVVASLSVPVPLTILFLTGFGEQIARFGKWLDAHVIIRPDGSDR